MANLTITIDENVLKKARIRAIHDGTSVNAVLRDYPDLFRPARRPRRGKRVNSGFVEEIEITAGCPALDTR